MATDLHRTLLCDWRQCHRLGQQHPLGAWLTFQAGVAWQVPDAATDASMNHAVTHHRKWSIHAVADDHGEAAIVAPNVHPRDPLGLNGSPPCRLVWVAGKVYLAGHRFAPVR